MLETLKSSLAPTTVMAVLWLALSWLRAAGIQWAILWPLNFLTGALAGMEGSALGGAIGKAILLICFNSLFRGLLMRRKWDGRRRDNVKDELKAQTKAQLFGRIPQYSNLKLLWKDRSPACWRRGFGRRGGAGGLSFPHRRRQRREQHGLRGAVFEHRRPDRPPAGPAHHPAQPAAGQKALRTVNRGFIDRIFAGFAVGMAAAVPVSCTKNLEAAFVWPLLAWGLPILLAALGVFCLVLPAVKTKKGTRPPRRCAANEKRIIRRLSALAGAAGLCLACAAPVFAEETQWEYLEQIRFGPQGNSAAGHVQTVLSGPDVGRTAL